jgi:hypothetical protein
MQLYTLQLKTPDDALALFKRAIKIRETLFGVNHSSVAAVLKNLAATHLTMKNYDE